MNQKSHNNFLKSLLLISKIRFSDVDEFTKFAKSDADRERKLNKIKKSYEKSDDEKNSLESDFLDRIFPSENLDDMDNDLDPDAINDIFMSDETYKKLADMIGEAMDEMDKQNFPYDSAKDLMNNEDFKVFKNDPSFEDLVDWFKVLLLANDGELQLTVTPGRELVIIFKNFVSPNGTKNESRTTEPEKQKRKRKPRNKKGPSSEQNDE